MRTLSTIAAGVVLVLAACSDASEITSTAETDGLDGELVAAGDATGPAGSAAYEITITNLTGGQPFTPPLAVAHRAPVALYKSGEAASFGLKEIAENGNLGPMLTRLEGEKHVSDLVVAVAGDPPPLLPGDDVTFQLHSEKGAKYFSFVSMLVCTNDGFTGASSIRLPGEIGESRTVYKGAYDAGTEINTEDFADLVPPCPALTGVPSSDPGSGSSDPALAEGGVVRRHAGVQGGEDLDAAVHGWSGPVARIVIERVY